MKKTVEKVINDWDPIGLFPFAPKDEYKREIDDVNMLINTTKDVAIAAKGIQAIFIKSFGDDVFQKSYEECLEIAESIINCESPT